MASTNFQDNEYILSVDVSVIPKRYPEFHGVLKNCQQHIQRIDDELGKLKTADAGKIAAKMTDLVEQITHRRANNPFSSPL